MPFFTSSLFVGATGPVVPPLDFGAGLEVGSGVPELDDGGVSGGFSPPHPRSPMLTTVAATIQRIVIS
jgi:hypothetical protein